MYILEKKPGVYVGYRDVLEQKFKTLDELIDYCYKNKLFNSDVKREELTGEVEVDWYLTNLVTKRIDEE